MPNQYLGVLLHTMRISGLSRVRTEPDQLLIIPLLAPHPVKIDGQSPGQGDLGGLSSAPLHEVEVLAAPTRVTSYCSLRCFNQQEPCHRTALLADVSQPSSAAAGVFRWRQP